jgi:hypothetical protein
MFILDYIIKWIIGWGGIGALISVALWAAWYFSPLAKTALLHAAVVVTAITVGGTFISAKFYADGRQQALHAIAAQDAKAVQEGNAANDDVQKCFAGGGSWNIADSVCDAAPSNP